MARRVQPNKICQREAGIAYIMVLLLLATLTSLSLAFLHMTGTQIAMTANRGESMQVHYLAESAANHAMWRLLNDPTFAPAADTYYMHSFANGRYGYKVRKPTATTFATVATVGAIGDIATQQSYVQYVIPSNVLSAYARTTTPTIQYRRLIGANWTDPTDTPDIPIPDVDWVEMEGCPIRKEIIMGSMDTANDINLAVWDGTSWGNPYTFTQDSAKSYKCFDIAYESQSGDALVVGRFAQGDTRYNIWDGTAWAFATAQEDVNLNPDSSLYYIDMASKPNSDEIMIALAQWGSDLKVVQWNGSSFIDHGEIDTSMENNQWGGTAVVYEQQSGDALVLWGHSSAHQVYYSIWSGGSLGPVDQLPDFGADPQVIQAAADPASDFIVAGAIDDQPDLNVAVWDGSAWIDSRELEPSVNSNGEEIFDIAWEDSGEDLLIVWAPNSGNRVHYVKWRKGTALADQSVQNGPDFQGIPHLVQLFPIAGTKKIILLVKNENHQLRYSLWTGDNFRGDPAVLLESSLSANGCPFNIAEFGTGSGGGGGGGNLAPVVEAGPDQTIYLPTNEANLDGTVTDDGLPNPPGAVTTVWSKTSGPGTVTFDDPSLVDTVARFSDAGEYVLKLTADDSGLAASDEVTITVEGGSKLLFVVPDASSLSSQDSARKVLMEGWGWTVAPISASATQSEFDVACASSQVAYISEQINPDDLGTKLRQAVIGVVNEQGYLVDEFGFSGNREWPTPTTTLDLTDNTHYITFPYVVGDLVIASAATEVISLGGTKAPGLQVLGMFPQVGQPGLGAIETGGGLYGGGTATNRRVELPWGRIGFDINSLADAGRTIMRRAIEWAAGAELCDADYSPTTKSSGFSTTTYGSSDTQSITYFPEGMSFNGVSAPVGGAWISVDTTDGLFYMTDMSGNLLTSVPTATANTRGVTLVTSGSFANHLATVDSATNTLTYVDMAGNGVAQLLLSTHGIGQVAGVGFIETTVSGTYDGHIAVVDRTTESVYVIDQGGILKTTIDVNDGTGDAVQDVGHLPGTDKIILPYLHEVRIYDLSGTLVRQYDTTTFGAMDLESVVINPNNCDHAVADKGVDMVMSLNTGGGGGGATDTDPPTPDPMTWASPPAAVDPSSITMTATTATDPSGVEYYFECTAGGGTDSGWQAGTTYVDNGLSPDTQYTYRVKARDRSANQNETGWSPEASATTLSNDMYVNDITMGYRTSGAKYYGQATVWIRAVGGADISGAVVSGDWSGSVSGTSMGTTGSDGKVMLESPSKKNGGTFTFTVTNVTKLGYTYNPSLNVETSDTITAP